MDEFDRNKVQDFPQFSEKPQKKLTKFCQLFEFGAVVDYKDLNGRTALFYAVKNKDIKTVDGLLKAGADVSLGDNTGMSPVALAKAMGNQSMVRLLMRYFKAKDKFQNAYKKIAKMSALVKEIDRAKNIAEVKKKWNSMKHVRKWNG